MKFLLVALSLSLLSSCGKSDKKWVNDFLYQTVDQENDKWIAADINVDLGLTMLPTLRVPLPSDYGYFRSWRINGENHLGLDLNLSTILRLPGGVATLPNGREVPVDTNEVGIIEVPIDQINGKVYVALANGVTLVGIATSLSQLDDIGLGNIGVFPAYDIRGVNIMAGVYTSNTPGSNGIAIFATIGGIWDDLVASEFNTSTFRKDYISLSKKKLLVRKLQRIMSKKVELDFVKK